MLSKMPRRKISNNRAMVVKDKMGHHRCHSIGSPPLLILPLLYGGKANLGSYR
jgi:hypothetical protein